MTLPARPSPRHVSGHIPWRMVDLLLQSHRSIWISTTRPDGRPHAVPVWYTWDGSVICFITGRATQKAANLGKQSWVVVHLGDGDDTVILEGRVEIVTDAAELAEIDAAYREKYVDPKSGAQGTIHNEGDDCYRVRVEHVMAWEYGVVRTRTDWRFDV